MKFRDKVKIDAMGRRKAAKTYKCVLYVPENFNSQHEVSGHFSVLWRDLVMDWKHFYQAAIIRMDF